MTISDYQLAETRIHRAATKTPETEAADSTDGPAGIRYIVEFAGTPRAGKTTALNGLKEYLEGRGLKVSVVEEQAGSCPLERKRHPDFNLWTASATVARMLDAANRKADVVLVDRGRFDALCWIGWHVESGSAAREDERVIDEYMRLGGLAEKTDLVVVMTVDPAEAVRRDVAVRQRESQGQVVDAAVQGRITDEATRPCQIIDEATLHFINTAIGHMVERRGDTFQLFELNTTYNDEAGTLHRVIAALREAGLPLQARVRTGAKVAADV